MTQITTGLRSVLSSPRNYDALQNALGANRSRALLIRDHIRPFEGMTIVDVGCGTAELLKFLPLNIEYHGYDLSQAYIDSALARHRERGSFYCQDVGDVDPYKAEKPADLVLAIGLLHHLDDEQARSLLRTAHALLAPGGRFVSVDGALVPGQSAAARFLILRDRGQNIRSADGYAALAGDLFTSTKVTVRNDLLYVPYTHCVLELTK